MSKRQEAERTFQSTLEAGGYGASLVAISQGQLGSAVSLKTCESDCVLCTYFQNTPYTCSRQSDMYRIDIRDCISHSLELVDEIYQLVSLVL